MICIQIISSVYSNIYCLEICLDYFMGKWKSIPYILILNYSAMCRSFSHACLLFVQMGCNFSPHTVAACVRFNWRQCSRVFWQHRKQWGKSWFDCCQVFSHLIISLSVTQPELSFRLFCLDEHCVSLLRHPLQYEVTVSCPMSDLSADTKTRHEHNLQTKTESIICNMIEYSFS